MISRRIANTLNRLVRGRWIRYSFFAGTNTASEVSLVLSALLGRAPLVDGPAIAEYERRFALVAGTKYALSFAAGRMGLYAILEALGIGPGDEVLLQAFTCVVVPNAILYRGARPVYVDIDRRTLNIDRSLIEAKITPRTKAIIVQHTFGLVCDVESISRIARTHGIPVIEDCAHALGATLDGRPAGSLGTVALFSTDHTKVIGTGTGGMVTTNDEGLAKTLRVIYQRTPFVTRARARSTLCSLALEWLLFHPYAGVLDKDLAHAVLARSGLWRSSFFLDELEIAKPTAYAYPARLSNVQALIGLSQLDLLTQNLAWRRRVAGLYEQELGVYAGLLEPGAANHAFLRYTFTVNNRAAWQRHFDDVVEMAVWFTSVTGGRNENLWAVGYEMGSCPVAEFVASHCVNLPTHQRVTRPERIVDRLRRACHSDAATLKRDAAPVLH